PLPWQAMDRAARPPILGFIVVLAVALALHYGFLPFFGRRVGIRETPAYFLAIALVPVALWLVPAFSRALARGAYEAHRRLFGGEGVYVRLPAAEPVRLRDTILMSIGPFAVALLAGFVTLLNAYVGSYERALVDLGLWAVRLFPAVFGAVSVYRLVVEPQVLPSLVAWCAKQGIETRTALPNVLAEWAAGNV